MLTEQDLLDIGFKRTSYNVSMVQIMDYSLGRKLVLSVINVGTPNEMVMLCDDLKHEYHVPEVIAIHNYDYDWFITKERINALINALKLPNETFSPYKGVSNDN